MQDHNPARARSHSVSSHQPHSADLLKQVVRFIMEHLQDDLSVAALAKRLSFKEPELLAAFQAHTGVALDHFVLRRRIERALDLLKNSNATEREIATGLGWGAATDFRAAFVTYLGVSPAEYRRRLQSKQTTDNSNRRKRPCESAWTPREGSRAQTVRTFAL